MKAYKQKFFFFYSLFNSSIQNLSNILIICYLYNFIFSFIYNKTYFQLYIIIIELSKEK